MANAKIIRSLLSRYAGVLKLRPEFVRRFYPDLARLGQKRKGREFIPERWIASSVQAVNPPPLPSGGLSMLADVKTPILLRDAIQDAPIDLLGERLFKAHGPEFRVLVKLLDPGESIVFHLHATDEQVQRAPKSFPGQRFGKDEAYYFLDAPKGPEPYTHVGLFKGVTHRDLVAAVKRGRDHALELSPSIYQHYHTGFFLPAGVPHRPGTALTLEVQQPSDVYTLLQTHAGGRRMPPEQIHPGFKSLEKALELVDYSRSIEVGRLSGYLLHPMVQKRARGGEVATIFPGKVCRTFTGQRIRLAASLTYAPGGAFAMLIWKGSVKVNGRVFRAGEEAFVAHDAAAVGVDLELVGDAQAEMFTFMPAS
jgi:hypothetical protein